MEQLKLVGQDAELKTGLFYIHYEGEHFWTQDHARRQLAVFAAKVLNGPVLADQVTDFSCPLVPIGPLGERSADDLPPQRIGSRIERPGLGERARRYL